MKIDVYADGLPARGRITFAGYYRFLVLHRAPLIYS
jgi:hypothetical protein